MRNPSQDELPEPEPHEPEPKGVKRSRFGFRVLGFRASRYCPPLNAVQVTFRLGRNLSPRGTNVFDLGNLHGKKGGTGGLIDFLFLLRGGDVRAKHPADL